MINLEQYDHVTLEITNYCNAKCKWCKTGKNNRNSIGNTKSHKYLSVNELEKMITFCEMNSIIKKDSIFDLFNWGEPFLNPSLNDIIKHLSAHGYRIGLSTNASNYVKLENLDYIKYLIISISGFTEESYSKIHGLNFEKIKQNIAKFSNDFSKNGMGNKVILNFHVYQYNLDELSLAESFCEENNIVFSPHIAYLADESIFIPYLEKKLDNETLFEASKDILFGMIEKVRTKQDIERNFECPQLDNLVLDEQMNVIPCCLFTSNEKIGNLYEFQSVQQITEKISNWNYCKRCISCGHAQIVTNALNFPYDSIPKETRVKVYYANNLSDFTEQETEYLDIVYNHQKVDLKIITKEYRYIRIDIIEGYQLRIKNLINDAEVSIIGCNGIINNRDIYFENKDPWVIYDNKDYRKYITISCDIHWS